MNSQLLELYHRYKKPFFIIVAIIVAISMLITFFTSGILDSSSIDKDSVIISLSKQDGSSSNDIKPGYKILSAGTYLATIKPNDSNNIHKQTITIKNFLRFTSLKFNNKPQAATKKMDPVKYNNFLVLDGGLVSYRDNDTVVYDDSSPQHTPFFDTCDNYCADILSYSDKLLMGYTSVDDKYVIVSKITPSKKTISPIKNHSVYPANSTLRINKYDGSFAVYDDNKSVFSYSDIDARPAIIELDKDVATGENGALVATTRRYTGVVFGNDYQPPSSGDGGETYEDAGGYSDIDIVVYDNKSGKSIKAQTLKNHATISSISLSPGGEYFTVNTSGGFELYEFGKDDFLLREPHSLTRSTYIDWVGGTSYIYEDSGDLYRSEVDGSSYTLFSNNDLKVSSFSYIKGKVHVSAFYTTFTDQMPVAMVIDPNKPEVNNSLIKRDLLVSSSDYSIGFDGEIFTIYRGFDYNNMRVIKGDLSPAYEYIKNLSNDPKIVVIE